MTHAWWLPYFIPYPFAALIAFVLGGGWRKRIIGAVALCLLVTLTLWSDTEELAGQMPVTARHIDPPQHFWKVPPIP